MSNSAESTLNGQQTRDFFPVAPPGCPGAAGYGACTPSFRRNRLCTKRTPPGARLVRSRFRGSPSESFVGELCGRRRKRSPSGFRRRENDRRHRAFVGSRFPKEFSFARLPVRVRKTAAVSRRLSGKHDWPQLPLFMNRSEWGYALCVLPPSAELPSVQETARASSPMWMLSTGPISRRRICGTHRRCLSSEARSTASFLFS